MCACVISKYVLYSAWLEIKLDQHYLQVKRWDPLRTRAIPERLRGVFIMRRYTNPRLPLPFKIVFFLICMKFLNNNNSSLSDLANQRRIWSETRESLKKWSNAKLNLIVVGLQRQHCNLSTFFSDPHRNHLIFYMSNLIICFSARLMDSFLYMVMVCLLRDLFVISMFAVCFIANAGL